MAHPEIDLDGLSADEQFELLDRLWERLGRNPELFPLTDEQRGELDARSEKLDHDLAAGQSAGIPWDEVLRRIKDICIKNGIMVLEVSDATSRIGRPVGRSATSGAGPLG